MLFCRSCFSAVVSFRYILVFLIFLFLFWATNLSKLMLLDFRCQKIAFLCKHKIFVLTLRTKVKVVHGSWNGPETVFHEMLGKKNFTAYHSLNNIFFHRAPLVAASEICKTNLLKVLKNLFTCNYWCFCQNSCSRNVFKWKPKNI